MKEEENSSPLSQDPEDSYINPVAQAVSRLSHAHAQAEIRCTRIYYALGFMMLSMNLVASTFASKDNNIQILILTVASSLLSVILNFFKIEQKIQKHHTAAVDLETLWTDMRLNPELSRQEVAKRKRLIEKHAPLLGTCCPL